MRQLQPGRVAGRRDDQIVIGEQVKIHGAGIPAGVPLSAQFQLELMGSSARPLNLTFSDSESIDSVPLDISFVPSTAVFPSLHGPVDVQVTVTVSAATPPGDYLLLMTVTDGLTSRSVYVPVEVA